MKLFLSTLFLLFVISSNAQDLGFIQTNTVSTYLNPASSGIKVNPNLIVAQQFQTPSISGSMISTIISYDQSTNLLNGGLGGYLIRDASSQKFFQSYTSGINYAYHLPITRKLMTSFGVGAEYSRVYLDTSELSFGNLYNPRTGRDYQSDFPKNGQYGYANFSAGFMLYGRNYYAGISLRNFAQINESLSLVTKVYGGYQFTFEKAENINLTAYANYQTQNGFHSLKFGSTFNYKWLILGAEFINHGQYGFLAGFQNRLFRISYAYNHSVSKLGNAMGGSHELVFQIQFEKKSWLSRTRKFNMTLF